jgi:hypothetical protein
MSVKLHQPVEGKGAGESYSGEREDWLVAQGYASREDGVDKHLITDVKAKDDPTLAANREAPGEKPPTTEKPTTEFKKGVSSIQDKTPADEGKPTAGSGTGMVGKGAEPLYDNAAHAEDNVNEVDPEKVKPLEVPDPPKDAMDDQGAEKRRKAEVKAKGEAAADAGATSDLDVAGQFEAANASAAAPFPKDEDEDDSKKS